MNETATKVIRNILRIRPRGKRQAWIEDAVIVMDGSASIGQCEFGNAKKAMQTLMEVEQPRVNATYAIITFGTNARIDFSFLPQLDAAKKIGSVKFPNGLTNTQAGLDLASNLFASGENDFSKCMTSY